MLKLLGMIVLAAVTLPVAAAVATGAFLLGGGVAMVSVDTPDVDLTLPVPVRLVDVGLEVAALAMPTEERRELAAELPANVDLRLGELVRELSSSPDGVLVEVRTPTESVTVRKDGRRLHVHVDAPDARVRVSVPTRGLERVADGVDDLIAVGPAAGR